MTGIILFVNSMPVELPPSATVGDVEQAIELPLGMVLTQGDLELLDPKATLADLGICPQSALDIKELTGVAGAYAKTVRFFAHKDKVNFGWADFMGREVCEALGFYRIGENERQTTVFQLEHIYNNKDQEVMKQVFEDSCAYNISLATMYWSTDSYRAEYPIILDFVRSRSTPTYLNRNLYPQHYGCSDDEDNDSERERWIENEREQDSYYNDSGSEESEGFCRVESEEEMRRNILERQWMFGLELGLYE